ncbi:MAG: hypothetical protein HZB09_01425 [Candidatus Yonathbacteria bacterium]|nr:hypothetical protein [Candidatus Niyogibacteria bacterium]MBI5817067.1 hypothetical protein [Candidatus Yonathbacteria bacterium]
MDIKKYASVLWDVPKNTAYLDEKFVIKRALSFGGIFLIKDLINSLGIVTVRSVFNTMKPTEMPQRRYNFFKQISLI